MKTKRAIHLRGQAPEFSCSNSYKIESVVPLKFSIKDATEGSFYPKSVFNRVSDVILNTLGGFLAGEELFIHTIAMNVEPGMKSLNDRYVFHNYLHAATLNSDTDAVRAGNYQNKYVVKRVPRSMNDACRVYVNELIKND